MYKEHDFGADALAGATLGEGLGWLELRFSLMTCSNIVFYVKFDAGYKNGFAVVISAARVIGTTANIGDAKVHLIGKG